MGRLSVPVMSLIYFTMALVWVIGAFITHGESLFWLFLIMVPVNIFAGIKMLNR